MLNYSNLSVELKETCKQFLNALEKEEENNDRCCLKEIQAVIKESSKDDFEVIEDIVEIMNQYGWNTGTRHDFG